MIQITKLYCRFALVLMLCLVLNDKLYAQNTWQQKIDYQINVKLDDQQHFLNADIRIVYHNNSPNALSEIWMHLFPNAFKTNESAFAIQKLEENNTRFQFAKPTERGYIDSLNFLVDGSKIEIVYNEKFPDIAKLLLAKPLMPGDSLVITTPFRVKIPYTFSRLGHVEQSYQISQWYPKPAVFDRKGWHPIPYLDQGEFYADYGSFDVKITLPTNYVVGASGELQTLSEQKFLDSLSTATALIKEYPKQDTFPISASTYKTIHYKQNNIHDFAWFADKRFNVLTSEVELPESKRKVKTYVMYTNMYAEYWKDASKYINDAVYYYSLWNGDYPYNYCTAVDGALSAGGGMEYPMITVIGEVGDARTLDRVIAHEVGHNWFYGIIGSNEREHPWMDEGINSFYENRYMNRKYSDGYMISDSSRNMISKLLGLNFFPSGYDGYLLYKYPSTCGKAQAINLNAEQYTSINYASIIYTKTALALRYLEQYVGTEKFDSIMHTYFSTWKFKHPYPEDMKAVFEKETSENMSWFFDDILNTIGDPEFKLKSVKKINNELQVKVSNTSEVPGPVFVSALDKNNKIIETQKTVPFIESAFVYFDNKDVTKIVIDPLYVIPESNRNNNTYSLKSPFHKIEPVKLQFLAGLTRPDKTNLFYMPVVGYNTSDGLLPGIALYNNIFPFKNIEWSVLPMYGLQSKRLNGTASINYYAYPKMFQEVKSSFNFSSFSSLYNENQLNNKLSKSFYYKMALSKVYTFKPVSARSRVKKQLSYRVIATKIDSNIYTLDELALTKKTDNSPTIYAQVNFQKENNRFLNPYKWSIFYEYSNNLLKYTKYDASAVVGPSLNHHKILAVYKQKFNYKESKKGVELRVFAGTIFSNKNSANQNNYFSISGNLDYTFDKAFFNRFGNHAQQFHEVDGGFKGNTFSSTYRSMAGINIKAPLKSKLPIGIFADAAIANVRQEVRDTEFLYDAGLYVPIIKDIAEIYFPLYVTRNNYTPNSYKNVIRFIIDFQTIQPLDLRRKLQAL